jgi:hypothetical protein
MRAFSSSATAARQRRAAKVRQPRPAVRQLRAAAARRAQAVPPSRRRRRRCRRADRSAVRPWAVRRAAAAAASQAQRGIARWKRHAAEQHQLRGENSGPPRVRGGGRPRRRPALAGHDQPRPVGVPRRQRGQHELPARGRRGDRCGVAAVACEEGRHRKPREMSARCTARSSPQVERKKEIQKYI